MLAQRIAGALAGAGGVVVVEGPPGIGKSRLLAEAVSLADPAGLRVARGEADEADQVAPLSCLLGALDSGSPPLLSAERLLALDPRPDQRYWLLRELEALLEEAALAEPLLLVIDDVQWADAATLLALRTLLPQLAPVPILWLLAARSSAGGADLRSTLTRLSDAGAVRISLGPLPAKAVSEVTADRLNARADARLLRLAGHSGGNPFLLVELLEGLREEGLVRVEHGRAELLDELLPARVREGMRDRLDGLSAEAREAVQLAAVLGRRFSVDRLALVGRSSPPTLLGPVAELMRGPGRRGGRQAGVPARPDQGGGAGDPPDLDAGGAAAACGPGAAGCRGERGGGGAAAAGQRRSRRRPGGGRAAGCRAGAGRDAAGGGRGHHRTRAGAGAGSTTRSAARWSRRRAAAARRRPPGEANGRRRAGVPADPAAGAGGGGPAEPVRDVLPLTGRAHQDNRRALALDGVPAGLRAQHLARLTHNLATSGHYREAGRVAGLAADAIRASGERSAEPALHTAVAVLEYAEERYERMVEILGPLPAGQAHGPEDPRSDVATAWRCEAQAVLDGLDAALAETTSGWPPPSRGRAWAVHIWLAWRGRLLFQAGRLDDGRANVDAALAMSDVDGANVANAAGLLTLAGSGCTPATTVWWRRHTGSGPNGSTCGCRACASPSPGCERWRWPRAADPAQALA